MKHIELVVEHERYVKFSLRDHDVFLLILLEGMALIVLLPVLLFYFVETTNAAAVN